MTHEFPEERDPRFEDSAQLEFLGGREYQLISVGKLVVMTGEGVETVAKS